MIWQDTGYLLKINNYSENSSVATFITNRHGLHNGIVYGATSKKKKITYKLEINFSLTGSQNPKMQLAITILN